MVSARRPRTGLRAVVEVIAALAFVLAVADGFRWGNRWYIASRWAQEDADLAHARMDLADEALIRGLVLLAVAVVAAVIVWRMRVAARR